MRHCVAIPFLLLLATLPVHAKVISLDYASAASKPAALSAAAVPSGDGLLRSRTVFTAAALAASAAAINVGDTVILGLFSDVSLTARVSRVSFDAFGPVYAGTIDGVSCVSLIPTADGLQIDAQAIAADRVYKVFPSGSATTIKEYEPPKGGHCGNGDLPLPAVRQASTAMAAFSAATASFDTASTLIDVLIVYDTGAASWANRNGNGITNFARAAVEKANNALANTDLDARFNFRLVGVTTAATTITNVVDGLYAIRTNNTAFAPSAPFTDIEDLRSSVGADTVALLIDTGSAYGVTGLGYSLGSDPVSAFADFAYCCCAIRSVSGSHTMTHEIGHNLGAGHANKQTSSPGPQWGATKAYSSGYYFTGTNSAAYHSIMAYNEDGYGNRYAEVPLFSSPSFSYMGTAVGTVASNDNTRVLRETYAAASKWRAQVVPVTSGVTFSPEDGTLFDSNLTVTLTPGTPGIPIYYTLDGTTPTTTSTRYTSPITVTSKTVVNAITYSNGNASPVYYATYRSVGEVLGVTQAVWSRGGDTLWYATGAEGTLQNGDFTTNGTSWLQGTFTGKGKLVYTLESSSYVIGGGNLSTVTVDGQKIYSWSYKATNTETVVLTNLFTTAGKHTVRWAYEVGYYQWYYSAADSYARLSALTWAPATTNDVPVPYTWLDKYFTGLSTDTSYNNAALLDSDGDGFAAWEEYLAGTDPTNAASFLTASIRMDGATPIIGWNVTNAALATYTVLGAPTLTNQFDATNSASRFFKVRAQPRP